MHPQKFAGKAEMLVVVEGDLEPAGLLMQADVRGAGRVFGEACHGVFWRVVQKQNDSRIGAWDSLCHAGLIFRISRLIYLTNSWILIECSV